MCVCVCVCGGGGGGEGSRVVNDILSALSTQLSFSPVKQVAS